MMEVGDGININIGKWFNLLSPYQIIAEAI